MVLKQRRCHSDVLIVDASRGFTKEGKNNKLRSSDIKRIVDVVAARKNVGKFSRLVSRDEIRGNEYNLNIPRYVDSSEAVESWDIYASMFGGIPKSEIDDLSDYWAAFPGLRKNLFTDESGEHVQVREGDLKAIIRNHPDVEAYKSNYNRVFYGFDTVLGKRLIEQATTLNAQQEEEVLAKEIFSRLESVPLVDKYEAYQLLSKKWEEISSDLEMIQTEGFETVKKVDPNMVTKKRQGKDVEIQEGWKGRVIPFQLVQDLLLHSESELLKSQESRLMQVVTEQEELIESLTEDDKEDLATVLNDDDSAFLVAPLKKAISDLRKENYSLNFPEDTPEAIMIHAKSLQDQESELKKKIKLGSEHLHKQTKSTIEHLSEEQVCLLLKFKWIEPLLEDLKQLPINILEKLASEIQAMADKYSVTLSQIEEEINETEQLLITMLDDLTGSVADMQGLEELRALLGGM